MPSRQTQQRIVATAVDLFNEHGTAAVSTNRIAEICRVSKGNLHYHFRSKQEIVQQAFLQIVTVMNEEWNRDPLHPTLRHMAEMFARHALLAYRYRFFFREMPHLLRSDPLLLQRYRENRCRRELTLEQFFIALDRCAALRLNGDRRLIGSLLHSTWIIADNWLNSIEFMGREVTEDSVIASYELILDIFRPYFRADEGRVLDESQAGICQHLRARGMPSASAPVRLPCQIGWRP
jgi:AcrR family transcriptional regulator